MNLLLVVALDVDVLVEGVGEVPSVEVGLRIIAVLADQVPGSKNAESDILPVCGG